MSAILEAIESTGKPRIQKYTKERPDGSIMVRYEVLDADGRRVPGQGIEGYDDLKNAKEHLKRIMYLEDRIINGISEDYETLEENLRKWFKEKWVRFNPQGKIMGACARGSKSEGKPKCLPQSKAHNLGKKGRASAAARKRREDPNPERKGPAKNVATKEGAISVAPPPSKDEIETYLDSRRRTPHKSSSNKNALELLRRAQSLSKSKSEEPEEQIDELKCWPGYSRVRGVPAGAPGSCKKKTNEEEIQEKWSKKYKDSINCSNPKGFSQKAHCAGKKKKANEQKELCPECGGPMYSEELINEKKDACYYKVKSRYKVWPSAYASGALVKCRKKGAKNWGNSRASESAIMKGVQAEANKHVDLANEENSRFSGGNGIPSPTTYKQETDKYRTKGSERIISLTSEDKRNVSR